MEINNTSILEEFGVEIRAKDLYKIWDKEIVNDFLKKEENWKYKNVEIQGKRQKRWVWQDEEELPKNNKTPQEDMERALGLAKEGWTIEQIKELDEYYTVKKNMDKFIDEQWRSFKKDFYDYIGDRFRGQEQHYFSLRIKQIIMEQMYPEMLGSLDYLETKKKVDDLITDDFPTDRIGRILYRLRRYNIFTEIMLEEDFRIV